MGKGSCLHQQHPMHPLGSNDAHVCFLFAYPWDIIDSNHGSSFTTLKIVSGNHNSDWAGKPLVVYWQLDLHLGKANVEPQKLEIAKWSAWMAMEEYQPSINHHLPSINHLLSIYKQLWSIKWINHNNKSSIKHLFSSYWIKHQPLWSINQCFSIVNHSNHSASQQVLPII